MRVIIIPDREVFDVVQTVKQGEVVICDCFDQKMYEGLATKKVSWAYLVLEDNFSWSSNGEDIPRHNVIGPGDVDGYEVKYASRHTLGFIVKGDEYKFIYNGDRLNPRLKSGYVTMMDIPVYISDGWEYFERDTSFAIRGQIWVEK